MTTAAQLVEDIYAAAVDAGGWAQVMGRLQQQFSCRAVGLYTSDLASGHVSQIQLRDMDPAWVDDYIQHHMLDNPWLAVPALQVPGIIRTDESLDQHHGQPGYYRRTAFYNEWMKPQRYHHSLSTVLYSKHLLRTKLVMYRSRRPGPFGSEEQQRFAQLAEHLGRAVGLAHRLALRQAGLASSSDALDRLNIGMVFLDQGLRVMQANRFAEGLFRQDGSLSISDGRLKARHRDDQRRLHQLLQGALAIHLGQSSRPPPTARLRRATDQRPLQVTAIPLSRRRANPFLLHQAAMVLMVTDPALKTGLPGEWLQQRYGLTAAEVRLALSLMDGLGLREAASRNRLTYETARSYLKIIFQKTGASRQSQLVSLLLRERVDTSGGDIIH